MNNNSAVIYVRVSTKAQDDKFSPDVQIDLCHTYAKAHGLKVVQLFREAASGWKAGRRQEYFKMIEYIENEKVPNLIYAFTDRVARNLDDWIPLRDTGVILHDAVSGVSFNPRHRDDYKKIAEFEHGLVNAKESSDLTGKKVRDAQAEKAKNGEYPGSPPLGYLLEPQMLNGKVLVVKGEVKNRTIIDPERGPLIKKMFELYNSGEYSLRQIVEQMKNLGLRSRFGRILTLEEIRRYLKTPFYSGIFRWGQKLFPNKGSFEPIISKSLFDSVQEVLDGRKLIIKRGKDFKYKGLLTCDFCGCALVGDSHQKVIEKTGKKKSFTYYHCTSGKRKEFYLEKFGKDKCPLYFGPYYTEEEIDGFFSLAIESLYVDPDTYEWLRQEIEVDYEILRVLHEDEVTNLRREHSAIETKESFIIEKIAGANPRLQIIYENELEKLDARKTEIEARIEDLERGESAISLQEIDDTLELAKALKDNYLAANQEKRKKLNKLLFRTVRISRRDYIATHDEDDPHLTAAPFYFVWNQPFKALNEIGFIQGMAEANAEAKAASKTGKVVESKKWRGRRDLNSRPLT